MYFVWNSSKLVFDADSLLKVHYVLKWLRIFLEKVQIIATLACLKGIANDYYKI